MVEVVNQNRFDVTVTSDVSTLQAIKVKSSGVECDLTLTSAPGVHPTWQFITPLNFVVDPGSGDYRIVPGDTTLNNLEDDDMEITGGFLCQFVAWGSAFVRNTVEDSLNPTDRIGCLCAAPGPAYLGPCPEP